MSAIVGIYFLDGRPVERTDLERMVQSVVYLGQDGVGLWSEGPVGLGHRMFWTTPESLHEKLPLVNETGDLVLTADARIDNREELISALGVTVRPHEMISDSALILGAYEKWGERSQEKLLGDFAFAIWDRRKQVLFCARDHFGIKPFYYYRSGRVFVFGSEIKTLWCLSEVPRRLNEVRIGDYLASLLEDQAITFYQDVFRLPAAHSITVSPYERPPMRYWSLDPSREVRLASNEAYAEALRERFSEAVRCRLRSAFPVGSMLSGGLDSSSIVCTARHLLQENGGGRLHTFSAVFDTLPQCDERPFINAVLDQGGLEPHFVHADQLNPLAGLDDAFWHADQLFLGPNAFMHLGLFHAAQAQGVRVLLDGFDGDSTVSHGVAYLTELAGTGRWGALATEVSALSKKVNIPSWKILKVCLRPLVPEPAAKVLRRLRRVDPSPWNAIINPDFARRINLQERIDAQQRYVSQPMRTSRADHWRRLRSAALTYAVETIGRTAAGFSLQHTFPFFDKQLAEFCLALPPEQKLNRGWTRVVMRRAMANLLPEKVQWRGGKADLSPMLIFGLLRFNRGWLEEVICENPQVIEKYMNISALREVYRRYVSRSTEIDTVILWKATALALWLRRTDLAREVTIA